MKTLDCYELLVRDAEMMGLEVIEKNFKSKVKGLCKGNRIGISKGMSKAEKRCVLAEEIAHAFHTVGDILDQNDVRNVKQELFARKLAYEQLVPLPSIVDAHERGLTSTFEMAEFLEVTEEFLIAAIRHYEVKHGAYTSFGTYIILFSPLVVINMHGKVI